MGNSLIQPSLTGGEISPSLHGRVDLARYYTSLKTCRNFIVRQFGGVTNRSGFRFVAEVADSDYAHRLVPFEFSTEQTYVLVFGQYTMQIIKDGGVIEASPGVPLEAVTVWSAADLPELNWTQSADVLTVVHPSYHPRQVTRLSHVTWTINTFPNINGPFQTINTDPAISVYASARYGAITLVANALIFDTPMIGTSFYLEQKQYGQPWEAGKAVVAGDIRRSDGKYYESQTSATTGSLRPTHDADDWSDGVVTWRYLHPGFGTARITGILDGTTAYATVTSPMPEAIGAGYASYKWALAAWGGDQGYPRAVTYHQNRQIFGGTVAQPQHVWMSKVGNYTNFGNSQPLVADDAITFPIPGRQVNAVRHLLPLDKLTIFTSGSEWVVNAQDDILAPDTIAVKPQGFSGTAKLLPVIANSTALYVQNKGKSIREFSYDFASDKYAGNDLTQMVGHFFNSHTIVDWAFQQVPFQTIWCVRSDGVLLGLTYLKEQQVAGWHRHDTDGYFESVAVIAEGGEDVLYAIVRRTINGATKRYIERMDTRIITDIRDAFFVDSGLTYDGRNTGATTLTLTTSTDWTYQAGRFTVTASAATFSAGTVGDEIHFPYSDADGSHVLKIAVTGFTSSTVVTGRARRDVPASLRATPTTDWGIAVSALTGMDHLEGKLCSVLADGHVHPQATVSSGGLSLQYAAVVVHAGLPITADIETLSVNAQNGEPLLDKKKLISEVAVVAEDTRGVKIGTDPTFTLFEQPPRSTENYDEPAALFSGVVKVGTESEWSTNGRVFIRQEDPLPATILAILPDVTVGGK